MKINCVSHSASVPCICIVHLKQNQFLIWWVCTLADWVCVSVCVCDFLFWKPLDRDTGNGNGKRGGEMETT
jgi:hypothetical protein